MNVGEERKAFEETVKDPVGVEIYDMAWYKIYRDQLFDVWCKAKEHAKEMAKPVVRIEKDPYGHWWVKFALMAEGKFDSAEAATEEALKRGARVVYTGPELPE